MKNESQEINLSKKEFNIDFSIIILVSFSDFLWVTVDKIAIIQERMKLLVWNFQEMCKINFYKLKV